MIWTKAMLSCSIWLAEATFAANARAQKHTSAGYSAAKQIPYDNQGPKPPSSPAISHTSRLPLHVASTDVVHRSRRTISLAEMQAKRAQGLCYFCDEKYTTGHKCNLPKQLLVLKLEGPDTLPTEEGDNISEAEKLLEERTVAEEGHPHISLCALAGIQRA
ncbi:uncharacterized protein LOC142168767 [Nicotiana tabacum]|uniref:Uncharacterized protein LOC142168767 n=1 Tax=Nicotiana tabacum TaxID=4097 RepID=A0AC58SLM7_TOBAC